MDAFAWIVWLVLIVLFVAVAAATAEIAFLMLAVGTLAGLILALFWLPWWSQIAVAAVVALLLIFTLRPRLMHLLRRGGDRARSNIDAVVQSGGRALQTVTGTSGQVKLHNGETWTARLSPSASVVVIEAGSPVIVTAVDGATAVVIPDPRAELSADPIIGPTPTTGQEG